MIVVEEGASPLVLCLPHTGTDVPAVIGKRLNATGRLQTDLSWRLEDVLRFSSDLNATIIRSTISRYVIDLDRDLETPLSASEDPKTALCPVTTLDGKRIYLDGEEPGATEVEQRVLLFARPFEKAVQQQVSRLSRMHRKVIVIDCQSMRSHIKGVTDKGLPVISVGSAEGTACDPDLLNLVVGSFKSQQGYTVGVDELVKGGHLTRTYGRPERGLHALSLLIAQRTYLRHESPPFEPDKSRVQRLGNLLEDTFSRVIDWARMENSQSYPSQPSAAQEQEATVSPPTEDEAANDTHGPAGERPGQPPTMLQVAE